MEHGAARRMWMTRFWEHRVFPSGLRFHVRLVVFAAFGMKSGHHHHETEDDEHAGHIAAKMELGHHAQGKGRDRGGRDGRSGLGNGCIHDEPPEENLEVLKRLQFILSNFSADERDDPQCSSFFLDFASISRPVRKKEGPSLAGGPFAGVCSGRLISGNF